MLELIIIPKLLIYFSTWQGWEPILRKNIFDNDTDTHNFFYFRLSAYNAKKSIGIAMNDDFAMKIKKNTKISKNDEIFK